MSKKKTEPKKRKQYSFKAQLAKGKKSEKEFLSHFGVEEGITRIGGRDGDLQVNWSGKILELKTDFYPDSPNLFIERWSVWNAKDDPKNKPGGMWQSQGHQVSVLAYWTRKPDELFLFDVDMFVDEFSEAGRSLILVNNQGYRSGGYKVTKEEIRGMKSYLGNDLSILTKFE